MVFKNQTGKSKQVNNKQVIIYIYIYIYIYTYIYIERERVCGGMLPAEVEMV